MLKALSKDYGCQFKFQEAPTARGALLFGVGKVDVLCAIPQRTDLDAFGTYVPFVNSTEVFIMLHENTMPTTKEQVLSDQKLRVGVLRGIHYSDKYDELVATLEKQGRIQVLASAMQAFKMLKVRHVDALLMSGYLAVMAVNAGDFSEGDLVNIPTELFHQRGCYLSNKSETGFDRKWMAEALYQYARKFNYANWVSGGKSWAHVVWAKPPAAK